MKKLFALGVVACLPAALSAEDPANAEALLGTTNVLVIDEAAPVNVVCTDGCMSFNRAVLTAHTQKVSTLRERGRWM